MLSFLSYGRDPFQVSHGRLVARGDGNQRFRRLILGANGFSGSDNPNSGKKGIFLVNSQSRRILNGQEAEVCSDPVKQNLSRLVAGCLPFFFSIQLILVCVDAFL